MNSGKLYQRAGLFVVLLVFFLGGYFLGGRPQRGHAHHLVARVNGEGVTQAELDLALTKYRLTALEDAVEHKLLENYAKRVAVSVSPTELEGKKIKALDADDRARILREMRSKLLIRKIILRKWTEREKQAFFNAFKEELTRYSATVICLEKPEDESVARRELDAGQNFELLSAKYSRNAVAENKVGRLDQLTAAAISSQMGPLVSAAVTTQTPGKAGVLTATPYGPALVRVDAKEQSFSKLEKDIDDLIVESRRAEVSYALAAESRIETDMLPVEAASKLYGKLRAASQVQKPSKEFQGANSTIPGLSPSASYTPSEIPVPVSTPQPVDSEIPKPKAGDEPAYQIPKPTSSPNR